ncbi:citrulline utilization hydrolase CtlX [Janibacter alittae]|uniref:Arginine deiminase-related protein n=1 Tax=Janibacter alittae TaxID=3115209 RepID=A0ABZ2MIE6_9MICO
MSATSELRVAPTTTSATSVQAPSAVVLVRPRHFTPNPMTAQDNGFQSHLAEDPRTVAVRAHDEVTGVARVLTGAGVEVSLFDDHTTHTPDSVFPNNWFSTHPDGSVALYPMYATNRRSERRADIIEDLKREFVVRRVIDYSAAEYDEQFLEGTGAMVLDHDARLAYACRSNRLSPELLADFCADHDYEPVLFDAVDERGLPVYHTNVLMSVGTQLALVGSGMITDHGQREWVLRRLRDSGKTVVELTAQQVHRFAGNCIELAARRRHPADPDRALVMSTTAVDSLRPDQLAVIRRSCRVLAVPVPTIEGAGGSVRCMIAGNHLRPRTR